MPQILPEMAVSEALDLLKKKLLEVLQGDLLRIIFFGSREAGRFREDSDIDVFIVIKQKSSLLRDIIYSIADEIEREILLYRIPLSLHVFDEPQYRTFKEKGSPFLEDLETRGEILYERASKAEDRIALARYRKERAYERLDAAEVLLSQGFYNDAISRAYYAIYAISRAILILYDIRASTHEGVKTMLLKELIREARLLPEDFAKKFSILKTLREDVDYEDFVRYSREDAEEALGIAREFVEKIASTIDGIIKNLER